ncbi:hypothetical protein [Nocardioides campestrisoli]|uniref:hypothetical protein n=1 Tax=Nocardioides campestrisoli TaxID=2736757 RepID=UPI0015E6387F|nr:hypothetical protein [Nocardioides campestrisoli]
MTAPAPARPPQVTLAGWMIIIGSLLVVVSVFEMMGGLRSLETREAIDSFLSQPAGETLGWGPEAVTEALRVASMITAGCATAAAVLGWHVLRRHRGARVGLTVLAVPLFFAGVVTGGFMSSFVAAASLMLWLQPARDWFNGKEWVPPTRERKERPADEDAAGPTAAAFPAYPGTESQQPQSPQTEARPVPGYGEHPYAPVQAGGAGARRARPGAVVAAAVVTWVSAGIALLFSALGILITVGDPDLVLEEARRQQPELLDQGVTEAMLVSSTYVVGGVAVLWSLAAVVAAVLLVRRVAWSRTLLIVLAVATALVGFMMALSTPLMLLPTISAGAVVLMLQRPDVRAWLRQR